jgi:Tol biopolymer transport system component
MRRTLSRFAGVLAIVIAIAAAVHAAAVPSAHAKSLDAANDAWERGDYTTALNGYIQLLSAPGGERVLEPIALTTGELFETKELTADGRAPRFSPDGSFIAYETGLETSRRTKILKNDASFTEVADLPGVSATFSSTLDQVAYLRIPGDDEIRRASDAIEKASLTARNRTQLTQTLAWLIARDADIVVRDLKSGREMELPTPELVKTGLAFNADGRQLYFLGAKEAEPERTDMYVISENAPKPVIVVDAGGLKSAPIVDPSGKVLIYAIPVRNPLRRPEVEQDSNAGAGAAVGLTPVERVSRQPAQFAIVELASRRVSIVAGTAPSMSADGKTMAYVARFGPEYSLMVGPTIGMQIAIKRSAQRLDAPALSADGSRVAYQMMVRDDWEIFVANRDGAHEQQVTHEIQHDLLPRFIGPDRLLAVVGEPRHRRSYLYDIGVRPPSDPSPVSGHIRTRLFHNNTVRTIAPEYQWAASPDGTKILIGAERDGNTVSPERGVYVVDLKQKVTRAELLDRLRANLKSESTLRAAGTHAFQSIAADVRQVLAHASVTRVLGYEKALFAFDSKHISKPGNRLASEFLFDTYRSFGYVPEYQWFDPSPRPALGGRTANVIATLRGTVNPELVYVVSSHYDSVEAGPGADDDSSGTAALLEAARVLAGHPMPATIVFASFTGEEAGLLGSREFVRRTQAERTRVVGALNNDMIGWTNDDRLHNTIRYSNPGIRDLQHAAAMLFTRLITYDALYFKGTDAASFYDAYGDIVGGIGSYPVLGSPHYHQASDLLEFENHELITETSKTTVATLMLLASSPSRVTHLKVDSYTAAATTLSWTPSPEHGVTSYIVAYGTAADPLRHRIAVTQPRALLPAIALGSVVSVKAVNARGLEGWDWAKTTVGEPAASGITQ